MCCHTQRKGGGAAYADRRDRKQLTDPSTVLNRNRLKQDKQSLIAELQGLYVEIRKTHKEEFGENALQPSANSSSLPPMSVGQAY